MIQVLAEKIQFRWDDFSAELRKKIVVGAGGLCRNIKKLFTKFTVRQDESRLSLYFS